MAVVEGAFANRLRLIAAIPLNQINQYEIHGDLRISKKYWCYSWIPFANPFNQVAELFKALDVIDSEIRRNDYAFMISESVHDLTNVFCTFKAIVIHKKEDELTRSIHAVQCRCFAYYPHNNSRPDGIPYLDLQQSYIELAFKVLELDLERGNYCKTRPAVYNFLVRFITYGAFIPEKEPSILLRKKINLEIINLFEKDSWNDEEVNFLKLFLENLEFTDTQYRPDHFFEYLRVILHEVMQHDPSKECSTKIVELHKVITIFKNSQNFFSNYLNPINLFTPAYLDLLMKFLSTHLNELPKLNQDHELSKKISDIFLVNCGEDKVSILILYIEFLNKNKNGFPFRKLHEAGFLVSEGPSLRISDEWLLFMQTLNCGPEYVVCRAFHAYSVCPPKSEVHNIYQGFNRGSSALKYPSYYIHEALKEKGSDALIDRIAKETSKEQIVHFAPILSDRKYPKHRIASLLIAADLACNEKVVEFCYQQITKKMLKFKEKRQTFKNPLNLPEKHFVQVINRLPYFPNATYSIDFIKFPSITLLGIKTLLDKFPTVNILNFPFKKPSKLSEIVITDGKRQLYINRSILCRASEYFRHLYSSGLKESLLLTEANGGTFVLDEENFGIFLKWINVILQPSIEIDKKYVEEADPAQYAIEINFAKFFGMPTLLEHMTEIYTKFATNEKFEFIKVQKRFPGELHLKWFPNGPKKIDPKVELDIQPYYPKSEDSKTK